jgi:hypothetical protein
VQTSRSPSALHKRINEGCYGGTSVHSPRQGRRKGDRHSQELLRDFPGRDLAIELWDGTRWDSEPSKFCRFTWHIHNPEVLQALFCSDRDWLWPSPIYRVISTSAGICRRSSPWPITYAQRIHFGREDTHGQKNWLATLTTDRGDCIWRVRRIISAQESCTCINPASKTRRRQKRVAFHERGLVSLKAKQKARSKRIALSR